jgi:uncharacterized protein YdaU (DUF1376 family)
MNYFEFHIGDYVSGTIGLSLIEHGVYTRLLIVYYKREEPFNPDYESLYEFCGGRLTIVERQAVQKIADRYFPIDEDDGMRHNSKADEVIDAYQRRHDSAVENGKKGGRPRKANQKGSVNSGYDSLNPNETKPKAPISHLPSPTTHPPLPNTGNLKQHPPNPPPDPVEKIFEEYRKIIPENRPGLRHHDKSMLRQFYRDFGEEVVLKAIEECKLKKFWAVEKVREAAWDILKARNAAQRSTKDGESRTPAELLGVGG